MIKSCVIDSPADTRLDLHCLPIDILQENNYFATVPMSVVRPVRVQDNAGDEELFTSFEEAISDRVARVSRQISRLPMTPAPRSLPSSAARVRVPFSGVLSLHLFWPTRQRAIMLLCLGLSLLMVGFDLMGLLVLSR